MSPAIPRDHLVFPSELHLNEQVAIEKISYMHTFAKSSTVATIVAPLLCIPLYDTVEFGQKFYIWLALMAVAVAVRIYLIQSIRLDNKISTNFTKLNWAVGIVTFVWGIGWLMLVPNMEWVNYLLYQIISLTVLYVGMVGYCVNWKTFYSFAMPLKIPELLFILMNFQFIIWPIAIGSMVTFYLALRMGFYLQSRGKSPSHFATETINCLKNSPEKKTPQLQPILPNRSSSPQPVTTCVNPCKRSTSSSSWSISIIWPKESGPSSINCARASQS
jgi:hypothetical protein